MLEIAGWAQHHHGHGPFEQIERTVEVRIVTAIFDNEAGVRDCGAVAAEKFAGLPHRQAAADVRQIHRDLAGAGNARDTSAAVPDGVIVEPEDPAYGEFDGKPHLALAV